MVAVPVPAPELLHRRDEIETRRLVLAQRLEDGYQRIEQALLEGTDVAAWEQFWVRLLEEYEEICDGLGRAA